jgi:hypothetical protein
MARELETAEGVLECHKCGVGLQAYVKKWGNWPRGVLGEVINGYFDEAPLGHCEILISEHDNIESHMHCCHDSNYVSKIMLTQGMIEIVRDHPTYQRLMGSGRASNTLSPSLATVKQSIGLMTSKIDIMTQLV